jgi:tetratricopeptide (TPR) repeat protein
MTKTLVLLITLQGCGLFGGDGGSEASLAAQNQMQQGDIPGAAAAFEAAAAEHPESVDAATGAALAALMRGDTVAADAHLARVEQTAGERVPEVRMRRALVAQQAQDWDTMRQHGEASGIAAGLLLAGEAALADGDRDDAIALFEQVSGGGAEDVAKGYVAQLRNDDPIVAGLSEAQALWALGLRKVAVRSVDDLLGRYPAEQGDKDAQLLVWSGRAASVRETKTAKKLLASVSREAAGQPWRKRATQAIIHCAENKAKACVAGFEALDGDAPVDGLHDARVTAAALIAGSNAATAKELAGDYVSDGAARALQEAGALRLSRTAAPSGELSDFLNAGG